MVTKDMTVGEIVKSIPDAAGTLMGFGLGCVMCPSAQLETLEEAATVHGLNVDELLNALNKDSEEK